MEMYNWIYSFMNNESSNMNRLRIKLHMKLINFINLNIVQSTIQLVDEFIKSIIQIEE